MIIINFKKYVSGEKAVNLAKICKKVADETRVKIIICVQPLDIQPDIECWSQKLEKGAVGFQGTLLNHSDYILPWNELESQAKNCPIPFCICVDSFQEAVRASKLSPNFIAYEPRELIGNKDKSVSSEKPDVIQHLTSNIKLPVLIGAGIHSPEDIKIGLKLGAKGFLLATDVVKAVDPYRELLELAQAFK
ncbi:MAG: triose-phosphate isomerase [Candidatus Amesbacteria bacterium]|nr:triose-phosphate isomerase [Candidatus Amesbacteria bacterium]